MESNMALPKFAITFDSMKYLTWWMIINSVVMVSIVSLEMKATTSRPLHRV